jgi:hypothetical protein
MFVTIKRSSLLYHGTNLCEVGANPCGAYLGATQSDSFSVLPVKLDWDLNVKRSSLLCHEVN